MKKALAILVIFVFVVGCAAAFAAPMDAKKFQEQNKTQTGDKRLEVKFWDDFVDLFTKQIPGTVDQKSSKHPYEPATK